MKTKLLFALLAIIFCVDANAQTYFSGGVYTSTTWTKANSPYIIEDTVVVFPGVTLTIEPGVVVEFFDNIDLEIRQATLIAIGTATDSITFTSYTSTTAGVWKGIYFNDPAALSIDYCVFKYAYKAIYPKPRITPLLKVFHSSFYSNTTCITDNDNATTIKQCSFYNNGTCINRLGQGFNIDSCYFFNNTTAADLGDRGVVTNCTFTFNQTGLQGQQVNPLTVRNCNFCNNVQALTSPNSWQSGDTLSGCVFIQNHIACGGIFTYTTGNIFTENDTALSGLSINTSTYFFNNSIFNNHVGIIFGGGTSANMYNNNVCHNTVYNLSYTGTFNVALPGICWCVNDSATIAGGIYDGYDNVTYGLVQFIPFTNCNDSVLATVSFSSCQIPLSGIEELSTTNHQLILYPNPATTHITITSTASPIKSIIIYNMLGEVVTLSAVEAQTKNEKQKTINENLPQGIYFVRVATQNFMAVKKLVVQ